MKKFFFVFLALVALVSFPSCETMPDYGSPEGKYWFTYYKNFPPEVIDLGATLPGKAFDLDGEKALAAYTGEEVIVGDTFDEYTIRKDKLNEYSVVIESDHVKIVFRMLAEDVARLDFSDTETGEKYGSAVFTRINANVRYVKPPEL